jgi:hypothetical protein
MAKTTITAPSIHTGRAKEEKKEYYFRNRKMPGQMAGCMMGDAPRKGSGEQEGDTITHFKARDGDIVKLSERDAHHLRGKGIEKPIVEDGPGGEKSFTGRYYLDRRFDLEEV